MPDATTQSVPPYKQPMTSSQPRRLRIALLLLLSLSLSVMALDSVEAASPPEREITTSMLFQHASNMSAPGDRRGVPAAVDDVNATAINASSTIQVPTSTPTGTFPVNDTTHGVPGNPTNIKALASDAQAQVTWDAPEDDGSDPILEYEILLLLVSSNTPLESTVHVGATQNGAVPTTAIVPNLQNGISYAFKVRARNTNGVSTWSAKSEPVSPLHPPDLCTSQTCAGHGACFPIYAPQINDSTSSAECFCKPGFVGHDCSRRDDAIQYFWDVGPWSKCSTGCGGGIRQRSATCTSIASMAAVSDIKCDGLLQPTLTYICNGFECGSKLIEVIYEIEMFYDDILFSSKAEHAFATAFVTEVASALQVAPSRLDIEAIVHGSIRVTFLLLPPNQASGKSLNDVVADLHAQIQDRTSVLRTQGTFARRVYPSGVKLSFMIAEQHAAGDAGDISIMGLVGTVLVSVLFISAFGYCLRRRHERMLAAKKDRKMKRMGIATSSV
ncbi:hypothetical protein SPRG_19110 [Saprolegnia parasitica CBS 223.65]|uniref:Fibronectin type-III domain-containing protein n=1 Tax=Saprolegnia parasitica (strain CBS 223.65) TaxID=695850 RepID=A0A067D5L4_SAPPC|nr:hypothetical protein SPRG_19110 [Saprolegnia parasitica CBS 223.65]KDO34292.1 hypothetical protein SPRG_19110 [Saprolegnia parasitica CBS 223.65]|eukprot:XP_012195303.1 hypothetical protein SPRG_19110 [Saprolegnia parasitica CBS 223.65]